MRRRHMNSILVIFVVSLFIGTSIVPAFSSNLIDVHTLDTSTELDEERQPFCLSQNKSIDSFHQKKQCKYQWRRNSSLLHTVQSDKLVSHFKNNLPLADLSNSNPASLFRSEWDIVVPDDYTSIQAAIDHVSSENVYNILVRAGTYNENVRITVDGVRLHGVNPDRTIINGNEVGNTLTLLSDYNTISGFTIKNSGMNDAGVFFDASCGNRIVNNHIISNTNGLWLQHAHANNISDNIISMNEGHGVFVDEASFANTVTMNQLYQNHECGVLIVQDCRNNLVAGNRFESNLVGVNITGVSVDNSVHHNQFVANEQNGFDDSSNNWDDTVGEGNYWSDYTGVDSDGDGIGDTPYCIPGGDSRDKYPLMYTPAMNSFSFQNQGMQSDDAGSFSNDDRFSFSGNTIVVPDDYTSIQEAVDHAVDGDTIQVRPGLYNENVVVDKTVNLCGVNVNTTVIDGGEHGHVVCIVADGVSFSGFSVQHTSLGFAGVKVNGEHCEIRNNIVCDCGDGINLVSSNTKVFGNMIVDCNFGMYAAVATNTVIENNIVVDENNDAFALWMLSNCTVSGNVFRNSRFNGILCLWSDNNCFLNNSIGNNAASGLMCFTSLNNRFEFNTIEKNENNGLIFSRSKDNIILNNSINDNGINGVYFVFHSNQNTMKSNMITHQRRGVKIVSSNQLLIKWNTICYNSGYDYSWGIECYGSSNRIVRNTIKHNTLGISIDGNNNSIEGNTLCENEFQGLKFCDDSEETRVYDNNISKNGQNGVYIWYASLMIDNSIINNTISHNGQWGIFTNNITYMAGFEITNNKFINNTYGGIWLHGIHTGIKLAYTIVGTVTVGPLSLIVFPFMINTGALILNNTIEDHNGWGLAVDYCPLNLINGNIVKNNTYGITLDHAHGNILFSNHFEGNEYGLLADWSFSNIFRWSNFIHNHEKNIFTKYSWNIFNHNYYDEYRGFGPKVIIGLPPTIDLFPLDEPYDLNTNRGELI